MNTDTKIEAVKGAESELKPMLDEFPKPTYKEGRDPCGECHLHLGEKCDICGAKRVV